MEVRLSNEFLPLALCEVSANGITYSKGNAELLWYLAIIAGEYASGDLKLKIRMVIASVNHCNFLLS